MLNVQRLRVLREVAARGSFSAAADSLSYTQSAISQAVATLEAETGAKLIERDRKGVRPTAAGAALVAHADAILSRIEAAEFDLALLFEFHHVGDSLGRGLREVDLLEDPMHVALPYGHGLAEKKELRL